MMDGRAIVVLIVEDEPVVRKAAVRWVGHAGFETLEAPDAHAALEVLETRPDISLLFTDVDMPGKIDGVELAEIVHQRWPDIKILVTSGRVSLLDADLPDDGRFLAKPYSSEAVRRAVQEAAPSEQPNGSMTAGELSDQLVFLGLSTAELARLTGTEEKWCEQLVRGEAPIPRWLNLLTVYWGYYDEALKIAREFAEDLAERGG
jgi:CheY-like chemotaxis protein